MNTYAPSMGKGLRAVVAVLTAASGLCLAGVAAAATPQQIYADAADNGRLDHQYSRADLARARRDATLAGYGNQLIVIKVKTPPSGPAATQVVKPPPSGPAATQVVKTKATPPAPPPSRSALPFTGSELATFVALGIALVAGGFLLRMMTGGRSVYR